MFKSLKLIMIKAAPGGMFIVKIQSSLTVQSKSVRLRVDFVSPLSQLIKMKKELYCKDLVFLHLDSQNE